MYQWPVSAAIFSSINAAKLKDIFGAKIIEKCRSIESTNKQLMFVQAHDEAEMDFIIGTYSATTLFWPNNYVNPLYLF